MKNAEEKATLKANHARATQSELAQKIAVDIERPGLRHELVQREGEQILVSH